MLTKQQRVILKYAKNRVKQLFKDFPVPAHSFDHVKRVRDWAVKIAKAEKADIFLCEMAAWLHDIGRTVEENPGEDSREHHELSYKLLREWFRKDEILSLLGREEKLELLYSVRYHWNNAANKYDTAWILRDADKLDGFGKVGIKRGKRLYRGNEEKWNIFLRHLYDYFHHIKTKTAKDIIKKQKLMSPVDESYNDFLRSKIKRIEL